MTNPSNAPSGDSKGFMGSSLFKVMLAVLSISLGSYVVFNSYNKKQATDDEWTVQPGEATATTEASPTEAEVVEAAEPSEVPLIDARTSYEYKETGRTFTLMDEGGPGPYEFICTSLAVVNASSSLSPQGSSSYTASNMTDMAEATAWAENTDGLGVGEWIEFKLTDEYKKWGYTDENFIGNHFYGEFVIQTGYAKSPSLWRKNSRPIKLKAYLNGHALSIIQLEDSPDFQTFGIFPPQTEKVQLGVGDVIRFEILDVVQGTSTKDKDACISEFHIVASCG
jgi:hypothetical protein